MYHDHDVIVMSTLLLKQLSSVYPFIGPNSKCGYVRHVTVESDYQERIHSLSSERVSILCDHEYVRLEDLGQGCQTNHVRHEW